MEAMAGAFNIFFVPYAAISFEKWSSNKDLLFPEKLLALALFWHAVRTNLGEGINECKSFLTSHKKSKGG